MPGPIQKEAEMLLLEKYEGKKSREYFNDLKRLEMGEPLAYVIGFQPFLGLKIYLDSHPLIPRPETEWWTEELIGSLERRGPERSLSPLGEGGTGLHILDLCAGSGAVGCAILAKIPTAKVYFGEIDPDHEATIRKNIRENNLDESRAVIGIGDLFEPFGDLKFDYIASNPPYIPQNRELQKSVADFEPSLALRAGADGLNVIRRIADEMPRRLAAGGEAWIECDSEYALAASDLFSIQNLSVHIRTDQYERPRLLVVSLP